MKKIYGLILFFVFFWFFYTNNSYAAGNFSTDYNVTYNVLTTSDTKVNLNITLTNLTENFYAESYDIQVGFSDIRNLTASDSNGTIKPTIKKAEKGSIIHINFNDRVVGVNKKINFNISFNSNDIAQNLKNVWDINIPGISSSNDFENFSATVIYPQTLGKPTFVKPNLPKLLENSTQNSITFSKEDLGTSGISLAFGDYQIYDFNLLYHLENKNVYAVQTEIALPPNTNYQEIFISQINPKPKNVYIDKDGNWLAQYYLTASKKLDITVNGKSKVFLSPKRESISSDQIKEYLSQKDYWEINNPKIKSLVKTLNTPEKIYQYVVSNLHYDFSRVESNSPRLGATNVLLNPNSAVCLEFTDLFVTLARAAGIPAREVNGYAYTDNTNQRPLSLIKDVLHAWPEYYSYEKQAWIMVDPTWGNTTNGVDYFNTLDFDHLTLVIHGISSTYPVPAGGYKLFKNLNAKDVNVSISSEFKSKGPILNSTIDMSNESIAGFPISGSLKIQNLGDTLSQINSAYIFSEKLIPNSQAVNISKIPPYGHIESLFTFEKTNLLTNRSDTIRIAIGNNTIYKNIIISPFFLSRWAILGGALIVSIILIISTAFIGYRSLSFFKQKR